MNNVELKIDELKLSTSCIEWHSFTHVISKTNEILAHMTTRASIRFQISRKYEPGWAITPKSVTWEEINGNESIMVNMYLIVDFSISSRTKRV